MACACRYIEYDPSFAFNTTDPSGAGLQFYELYDLTADEYQVDTGRERAQEEYLSGSVCFAFGFSPLDHQLVSQCNRGAANAAAQLAGATLALQGDLIPAVQLPVNGNYVGIFSLLTPAALTPCNFSKDTPCVYIVKKKRQ